MPHLIIAVVTSIGLIAFAIVARVPTYHTAPAFLLPVTWAIYLLRRRLNLSAVHYALLCSALLLHMSGALGFYQNSPFPISFDIVVHYYFALCITLVLYRALAANYPVLSAWQLTVLTFFILMGLAALHEIMEFSSYLLLGEESGMLKPQTSYVWDTARDLTNNLLGTVTGLAGIGVHRRVMKGSNEAQNRVSNG